MTDYPQQVHQWRKAESDAIQLIYILMKEQNISCHKLARRMDYSDDYMQFILDGKERLTIVIFSAILTELKMELVLSAESMEE